MYEPGIASRALAPRPPRPPQRAARGRPRSNSFASRRSVSWLWSQLLIDGHHEVVPSAARCPLPSISPQSIPSSLEWLVSRRLTPRQSQPEQSRRRRRRPRIDDDGISAEHGRAGRVVVRDGRYCLRPRTRHDAGVSTQTKPMATDGQIHTGQLKDLFASRRKKEKGRTERAEGVDKALTSDIRNSPKRKRILDVRWRSA